MDPDIPVLVVGGGAGGVMMTAELRRRGIASRTVDKLPRSHNYSKALVVHARTLEMFERLDEDVLNKFLERGHPMNGFTFTFQGIDERPVLDFRQLDTRYPFALSHRQDETEQFVHDFLREKLDYEVEWNTELVALEQDEEGVTAKLVHRDRNDEEETVRARYVVACDGLHSIIRTGLGLDYEGSDYTGMVLQNMDVPLSGFPGERDEWLNFFMTRDRFILIARLPGGHYRLLLSDMGASASPDLTPKRAFQDFVDDHLENIELGEPIWASQWDIWTRLAGTYRAGNIFLVGDSAHVHSPAGGQGMNCCMQDANNLAWKLALVVEGKANTSLLDSYEAERLPIAEQVIGGASAIHQIIMGHGKDLESRFELADQPEWLDMAVGRLSGIAYTYRDAVPQPEGLADIEGPGIGDRAPDADLRGGTNLFSYFRHPGMTLLLLPGSGNAGEQAQCKRIADAVGERYGAVIHSHTFPVAGDGSEGGENSLQARYGHSGGGRLYLVRPDGYIGHRCLLSEAESLDGYLSGFLKPA